MNVSVCKDDSVKSMQSRNDVIAQDAKVSEALDEKRLWIGNLDPRITEYHLLKLIQKYGAIEKFDLLFHRTGALAGQPRGYAFVTYMGKDDALRAKSLLHNKMVGSKNIVVTWAHSVHNEEIEKQKPEIKIPALSMSKPESKVNKDLQIQAIEAKLKLMAGKSVQDEFEINKTVATEAPVISQYQHKQQQNNATSTSRSKNNFKKFDRHSNRPYNRPKVRR